ncbi:MAG: DEAD/DEAH box helicase [Vicinamibacterales bacterium]
MSRQMADARMVGCGIDNRYAAFLSRKIPRAHAAGIDAAELSPRLFPWQRDIVRWAARKGRAAIFADCGLGKTPMQLSWCNAIGRRSLILAPLCVAEQTVAEAAKFGMVARYVADAAAVGDGINVTNYERLHKFDPSVFDAVVLDESSILKAFDGKTRAALIRAFASTPYRLCCTATPAPNDIAEMANHAEFLGLMTRQEFLASWFVHDDEGWRMKRHARRPFFRWMASWAMALRKPSDIGYPDDGFELPPLKIEELILEDRDAPSGSLFAGVAGKGIQGRMAIRRASLDDRVGAASILANDTEQWLLWCGLNDESNALGKCIAGAVEVSGSDSYEDKVLAVKGFVAGDVRAMVSKGRILGFGLNLQNCGRMAFVGIGDSYEMYYQCIRRCWRFGRVGPVRAVLILSESERHVAENVRRKERHASELTSEIISEMADFEREEIAS